MFGIFKKKPAEKLHQPPDHCFHNGIATLVGGNCHHVKPCHPDVAYVVQWNGKITDIGTASYLYGQAQIVVWKKSHSEIKLVAVYKGLRADAYRDGFEVGILVEAASSFGKAEARALKGTEAMYAD